MDLGKLFDRLSHGDLRNVAFSDFRRLVEACGFELDRIRGSHHIYGHPLLGEKINLQCVRSEAKPYQIRQFLELASKYDLKPRT